MRWTGEHAVIGESPRIKRRLVEHCHRAIRDHEARLTELDREIGDADHGVNMLRGLSAVADHSERIATLDDASALGEAGRILVMSIGGASGPLYGTLLIETGRALGTGMPFSAAFAEGVAATARRGRAERGDKTLLDVLYPLAEALRTGETPARLVEIAASARDATRMMLARRGRASFLGARSIGHVDPGAESAALLCMAVVTAFAEETGP